jgi:Flp pilus assembly CpaF family ATPase
MYGNVIEDARIQLQEFQSFDVLHIRISANKAAHDMTKIALRFRLDRVWVGEILSCILSTVLVEQSPL